MVVRNGSHALLWLELLVEVETAEGRIGYSNVDEDDVAALFDADLANGGAHEKRLGVVDTLPWLAKQQRLTFARIGITDPLSTDDYVKHSGLECLGKAIKTDGTPICT